MQPISLEHMRLDQIDQGPEHHRARADRIGQGRQAEIDTLPGVALALAIGRLMHAIFLEQDHGQEARPGETARNHMKGAGGWKMLPQCRQVNFSRTYWITFHCRGMTSSVPVTSSPSLASLVDPQQSQDVGPGSTIRSRGRCSGKAFPTASCA